MSTYREHRGKSELAKKNKRPCELQERGADSQMKISEAVPRVSPPQLEETKGRSTDPRDIEIWLNEGGA